MRKFRAPAPGKTRLGSASAAGSSSGSLLITAEKSEISHLNLHQLVQISSSRNKKGQQTEEMSSLLDKR